MLGLVPQAAAKKETKTTVEAQNDFVQAFNTWAKDVNARSELSPDFEDRNKAKWIELKITEKFYTLRRKMGV